MFQPYQRDHPRHELMATTGDYLRLWSVGDTDWSKDEGSQAEAKMECLLNNNKSSEFCAPLTSFDWNPTKTNQVRAPRAAP